MFRQGPNFCKAGAVVYNPMLKVTFSKGCSMKAKSVSVLTICASAFALTLAAHAQAPEQDAEDAAEPNPDESADLLNSRQQLQQTFTLQRTIDGEVVESDKRTVTFSHEQPYRETEAGATTTEQLKAAFDREVLTRKEAFEEARLDFTIADADRDGAMSIAEFVRLAESWQDAAAPHSDAGTEAAASAVADGQYAALARKKFTFMAGAAAALSRDDYIRERLFDFDAMDADKDALLKGEELTHFRLISRGAEPAGM